METARLEKFVPQGEHDIKLPEFVKLNHRVPHMFLAAFRLQREMRYFSLGEKRWHRIVQGVADVHAEWEKANKSAAAKARAEKAAAEKAAAPTVTGIAARLALKEAGLERAREKATDRTLRAEQRDHKKAAQKLRAAELAVLATQRRHDADLTPLPGRSRHIIPVEITEL
jgi:hypothetical protein